MKLLAYFLVCLLILSNTTDAEAGGVKEIYTNVEDEIALYYEAGGQWSLESIDQIRFENSQSAEFILVCAKTTIRNIETGKQSRENCLLSFLQENSEFNSINCVPSK